MASMLLRNLDAELIDALKERAAKHGRSVQQELHAIVREAVTPEVKRAERRAYYERAKAINDRLAAAGRSVGDSTFDIRMDRDSNYRRF
jgi:plasmid stability protein